MSVKRTIVEDTLTISDPEAGLPEGSQDAISEHGPTVSESGTAVAEGTQDAIGDDAPTVSEPGTGLAQGSQDGDEGIRLEVVRQLIRESVDVKVDGLMIAGQDWNIVTINGQVSLCVKKKIIREPTINYKGVAEITSKKWQFGYELCTVDNGELWLLISSDYDESFRNGKKKKVVYADMVVCIDAIIKDGICICGGKTTIEFRERADGRMIVSEREWEVVGQYVAGRLHNLSEHQRDVLPKDPVFHFVYRKFGQDQPYDGTDFRIHRYPHVRMENAETTVIHIAHDIHVEEYYIFFNDNFPRRLGVRATKGYNIGMIPHTKNFVYGIVPANANNICHMQQYIRMFHSVHKNLNKFFGAPIIAKALLQSYCAKLCGKKQDSSNYVVQHILRGDVNAMYEGLRKSVSEYIPASRTEFVWARNRKRDEDEADDERIWTEGSFVEDAIDEAWGDAHSFVERFECCDADLFTIACKETVEPYLLELMRILFGTINRGRQDVGAILRARNLLDEDALQSSVSVQEFADMYVSEAYLKMLLRGDMCRFSPVLGKYIVLPGTNSRHLHVVPEDEENNEEEFLEQEAQMNAQEEEAERMEIPQLLHITEHWPFRREVIWEEDGILKSTVSIAKLYRNFDMLFGEKRRNKVMMELYPKYKTWMSVYSNQGKAKRANATWKMFEQLSYATIQCVLLINDMEGSNDTGLYKLWNCGKVPTNVKIVVEGSLSIYKKLMEKGIRTLKGLAVIVNFMQVLKAQMTDRQEGGCQRSLALALETLMIRHGEPFLLRIPNRANLSVYLPIMFTTNVPQVVKLYEETFLAIYKTRFGAKNIHVHRYLEAYVNQLSQIFSDDRPQDIRNTFDVIKKLLDNNRVKTTEKYRQLPRCITIAFDEVDSHPELAYFAEPPSQRPTPFGVQSENEGSNVRVTRSSTLRKMQLQMEQDAVVREFVFLGNENVIPTTSSMFATADEDYLTNTEILRPAQNFGALEVGSDIVESEHGQDEVLRQRARSRTGMDDSEMDERSAESRNTLSEDRQAINRTGIPFQGTPRPGSSSSLSVFERNELYQYSTPDRLVTCSPRSLSSSVLSTPTRRRYGAVQRMPAYEQSDSELSNHDFLEYLLSPNLTPQPSPSQSTSSTQFSKGDHRNDPKRILFSPQNTDSEDDWGFSIAGSDFGAAPSSGPYPASELDEPINAFNRVPFADRSDCCSEVSVASNLSYGLACNQQSVSTGTPFDTIINRPEPATSRRPLTSNTPKVYTSEEIRRIFTWMDANGYLLYMKGTALSWLMSRLEVVDRSPQGILSLIRRSLDSEGINFGAIIGDEELYRRIRTAETEIRNCDAPNILPKGAIEKKYKLKFPINKELMLDPRKKSRLRLIK